MPHPNWTNGGKDEWDVWMDWFRWYPAWRMTLNVMSLLLINLIAINILVMICALPPNIVKGDLWFVVETGWIQSRDLGLVSNCNWNRIRKERIQTKSLTWENQFLLLLMSRIEKDQFHPWFWSSIPSLGVTKCSTSLQSSSTGGYTLNIEEGFDYVLDNDLWSFFTLPRCQGMSTSDIHLHMFAKQNVHIGRRKDQWTLQSRRVTILHDIHCIKRRWWLV